MYLLVIPLPKMILVDRKVQILEHEFRWVSKGNQDASLDAEGR